MVNKLSDELMEELLIPFSEASPAGEYLKDNKSLYRSLRNTYAIAHGSFQKLLINPVPDEQESLEATNRKNWETLEIALFEVLKNNSRDLECMVWLTMAQLFSDDPYIQFTKGLMLITRCLETYGERIQPFLPDEKVQDTAPEEASLERARTQCRPLILLLGESSDTCSIVPQIKMLPLIGEFTYIDYCHHSASQAENDDEQFYDDDDDDENQPDFQKQVTLYISNHREEISRQIETLSTLISTLDGLEVTLNNHFQPWGIEEAHTCFIKEAITDNLRALKGLVKDTIILPADNPENNLVKSEELESASSQATTPGSATLNHLNSRDEAFQQLKQLSCFFSRNGASKPCLLLT